jgi:hypothetical protein
MSAKKIGMTSEEIEQLMYGTTQRGEDTATYIVSPTVLKKIRDWVWTYKIVGPKVELPDDGV